MKIENGYTLIEILVVIALVAILSGMAFQHYGNYNSSRQLTAESSRLATTLEEARKRASSGDLSTTCTGTYQNYRVRVYETGYELRLVCSGSNTVIKNISFTSGVKATNPVTDIDFKPLGTSATAACIILHKSGVENNRCIQVLSSGTTSEDKCSAADNCP